MTNYQKFYANYKQYNDHIVAAYFTNCEGYFNKKIELEKLTEYQVKRLHYYALRFISMHLEDFAINEIENIPGIQVIFPVDHDYEIDVSKLNNREEVLENLFDLFREALSKRDKQFYFVEARRLGQILLKHFDEIGSVTNLTDKLSIQLVTRSKDEVMEIEENN